MRILIYNCALIAYILSYNRMHYENVVAFLRYLHSYLPT